MVLKVVTGLDTGRRSEAGRRGIRGLWGLFRPNTVETRVGPGPAEGTIDSELFLNTEVDVFQLLITISPLLGNLG